MPNALQITDPNADNPLAQVPSVDPRQFFAETESELSPLELWLAQQRAKNNARGFEPLPGITSGAPPKPWGLDRTQLPQQQQLPVQPMRSLWGERLAETRPAYYDVDPRAMISDLGAAASPSFKIWRGGTVLMPPSQDTRTDRGVFWLSPSVPSSRTQMRQ